MLKAYKYRIYPNKEQAELIHKHFGCCRLVYNLALQVKNEAYRTQNKYLSAFDLCYQLPELKKEFEWLSEVDSQSLQASIKNMDKAFKAFFQTRSLNKRKKPEDRYTKRALRKKRMNPAYVLSVRDEKGFPKFKSKLGHQSFQCPSNTRRVNWEESTLDLPKIKGISIKLSRAFKGKIKTVTISKTPTNKYFASILVETNTKPKKKPKITAKKTIGIDLGLNHLIITSDGIKVDNPRYLRETMSRLKVLQRRASKKEKGSQNRKKANLRVAVQHEKINNKRDDYLHKLSYKLTHDNQVSTICAESLSVSNMVKNHKLAQAITDASWSKFMTMLDYKCEWYGKNLIRVDRFEPTTKTCNNCGFINENLTLKDRVWKCEICGAQHDRDINAAKNTRIAGLKQLTESPVGSGDVPVESSSLEGAVKQETIKGNSLI